jgi:hypothetical protein
VLVYHFGTKKEFVSKSLSMILNCYMTTSLFPAVSLCESSQAAPVHIVSLIKHSNWWVGC